MNIEELAREMGFNSVALLTTDQVVTSPELAAGCNPNACQKYASCWTCPPGAGTYEELQPNITTRRAGVLVQTLRENVDYYEDWEVLAETRTLHNSRLDKLAAMMREKLGDVAVFSTGGCDLCETCTYPDAPCARPDARRHSLSAHGVAVGTTCQNAGMDYSFINGSVRYIGMILYN